MALRYFLAWTETKFIDKLRFPKEIEQDNVLSDQGLLRITQVPFGMKNAPRAYQLAMDVLLTRVRWQFALNYLNDIIIFLEMPHERMDYVWQVLTLFQETSLTSNLKNSEIFTNSIAFLGHKTRHGCLKCINRHSWWSTSTSWPHTQDRLPSFLGFV